MKKSVLLLLLFLLFSLMSPTYAQANCLELIDQAIELMTQAQEAFSVGDPSAAKALVTAARTLLAPCLESEACPTAAQADGLLGQIETTISADFTTAATLLDSAVVLFAPCSATEEAAPAATPSDGPVGNGLIAFASNRDGDLEIYVMKPDGTDVRNLSQNPGQDYNPGWSPDGSRIAFVSDRDGNPEIYVMSADGTNVQRLTNNQWFDDAPTWSPDGSRIAWNSRPDQKSGLYVMNADGSNPRLIADNYPGATGISWAENDLILYAGGAVSGSQSNLFVVLADGSRMPVQLTMDDASRAPRWSPDATRILFTRSSPPDVYVMETGLSAVPQQLTDHPESDTSPAWSPDGRQIVFVSSRDGNYELYLMNADGSALRRLTTTESDEITPEWQPVSGHAMIETADPAQTAEPGTASGILVNETCSLVDAIVAANTDAPAGGCSAGSGDDTIVLTSDVVLTESYEVDRVAGRIGLPEIDSSITLDGAGFTISRAANAPAFRFFYNFFGTLTLRNVTLLGGRADDTEAADQFSGYGGAILNFSVVTLENVVLENNSAARAGGAIYNLSDAGRPGEVTVLNSTAQGNTAPQGAFMQNLNGTVQVSGSRIINNVAEQAFILLNTGRTVLSQTVVASNSAASGLILGNARTGTMTIVQSAVHDNDASGEGTVYNQDQGVLTVENSTISGNAGIGITLNRTEGQLTVTNATIVFNAGGGIYTEGTVTINNTIISGNGTANCSNPLALVGTIFFTGANNLIGADSEDFCAGIRLGNITNLDNNLADNGGLTPTHALLEGSSAINGGAAEFCPPTDQRGAERVGGCDIGAFEFGGAAD